MVRPSFSIHSETAITSPLVGGRTWDDSQVPRGFDQLARNWRRHLRSVATVLYHHRKRDAAGGVTVVRCETGEPGMWQAFVHLRRARFAGDRDVGSTHCTPPPAA